MFRGATKVTLDDKGRMVMPTRYREEISQLCQGHLVVTVNADECLVIYPLPEWEKAERNLMSLPSLDPEARGLQRIMVGHATDLELDGHGRFLLPAELRDFARLGRSAMLIGQGHRFELWDETRWNEGCAEWIKSGRRGTELSAKLEALQL